MGNGEGEGIKGSLTELVNTGRTKCLFAGLGVFLLEIEDLEIRVTPEFELGSVRNVNNDNIYGISGFDGSRCIDFIIRGECLSKILDSIFTEITVTRIREKEKYFSLEINTKEEWERIK